MSDRCASNKAAIRMLEQEWGKTLNKLFCHVHPIDTITSQCRQAINKTQSAQGVKGSVFGRDCIAANVVLAVGATQILYFPFLIVLFLGEQIKVQGRQRRSSWFLLFPDAASAESLAVASLPWKSAAYTF
jgi:hypothetical protein